ncbi:MAG: putative sulfate exporter family transporter [Planctomycetota bacterium]
MTDSENPRRISEDILAIGIAWIFLVASLACVRIDRTGDESGDPQVAASHVLTPYVAKPGGWVDSPLEGLGGWDAGLPKLQGVIGSGLLLAAAFSVGVWLRGQRVGRFLVGFAGLFLLGCLAYGMAGQALVKAYNLEYALWALAVALVIANTVGVPEWLRPAIQTEFFIKTGLVLLGSEILLSRLLALGLPGVCVAWVVTPIVLITTFWFGQKVLRIESPTLNMVVSADMSVCGVSAAIASAAACRAKKEELSLAIGLSLTFTVMMMVVMPAVIGVTGMSQILGGAWMGGTIDSTGAVAAAGEMLGDEAASVAVTIKMIQNILIGVVAFGIAVFWTTVMEPRSSNQDTSDEPSSEADDEHRDDFSTSTAPRRNVGLSEIWFRFPKFILGFVAASLLCSFSYGAVEDGGVWVSTSIGVTKTLRGWMFCLAFVSIGLETDFRRLRHQLKGGKPLLLYAAGQTLNLTLTLAMAYLMFEVVFKDVVAAAP